MSVEHERRETVSMDNQQKIKDLQEQIEALKAQEISSFDWNKAPIICELNGYRWHLGPEADNKLNWDDAKNWCESVGGELPPREVILICYINEGIRPLFKPEWYWSSTELDETLAFLQAFYDDGQDDNFFKTDTNYVRAVRVN